MLYFNIRSVWGNQHQLVTCVVLLVLLNKIGNCDVDHLSTQPDFHLITTHLKSDAVVFYIIKNTGFTPGKSNKLIMLELTGRRCLD